MSLLAPEEGHKDILIDQVRALQHTCPSPYTAKYRIALLPNFNKPPNQPPMPCSRHWKNRPIRSSCC